MRIKKALTGLCSLAIATMAAAPAQAELISAANPKDIFLVAKANGFKPEMTSKKDENPSFRISVDDTKSIVLFMNCDDDEANCKTVQFYAGFSVTEPISLDSINNWNREKRFARAYVDLDLDPVLEMDLDLDFNGLPRENVAEAFSVWRSLLTEYQNFVSNNGAMEGDESAEAVEAADAVAVDASDE